MYLFRLPSSAYYTRICLPKNEWLKIAAMILGPEKTELILIRASMELKKSHNYLRMVKLICSS